MPLQLCPYQPRSDRTPDSLRSLWRADEALGVVAAHGGEEVVHAALTQAGLQEAEISKLVRHLED